MVDELNYYMIERESLLMYKVTQDEIEIERTLSEVVEWVFSTFDKIASSREGITSLRKVTYPEIKVFLEESYPLALFCKNFFSEDDAITISQKVGNQSYDAKISGHNTLEYIEITNAIDGYDEKLRNIELDRIGSVPGVGEITITGTKASGNQVIHIDSKAVLADETKYKIKEKQKKLILEAIDKKSKIDYPPNTMLIVSFNDMMFNTDKDIVELQFLMEKIVSLKVSNFAGISLVGILEKVFITV